MQRAVEKSNVFQIITTLFRIFWEYYRIFVK
jgi:hypothetical protein